MGRTNFLFGIIFVIALLSACSDDYTLVQIRGDVVSAADGFVRARRFVNQRLVTVDSCRANASGRFSLHFNITDCQAVELDFAAQIAPLSLVVYPGERLQIKQLGDSINISGSYQTAQLQGLQHAFNKLNQQILHYRQLLADTLPTNKVFWMRDTIQTVDCQYVTHQIDSLLDAARRMAAAFVADNPYSLTAMMVLNMQLDSARRLLPYDRYRTAYRHVDSCLRTVFPLNFAVQRFAASVQNLEAKYHATQPSEYHGVGDYIQPFNLTLLQGERITVPFLRGRLVLLCFIVDWGTQMPQLNLSLLQQTFAQRGLRIVQIHSALDTAMARQNFINQQISWPCAVIGNPRGNPVIDTLRVERLPANFLLDKHGRILAQDADTEQLIDLLNRFLIPINQTVSANIKTPQTSQSPQISRISPTPVQKKLHQPNQALKFTPKIGKNKQFLGDSLPK